MYFFCIRFLIHYLKGPRNGKNEDVCLFRIVFPTEKVRAAGESFEDVCLFSIGFPTEKARAAEKDEDVCFFRIGFPTEKARAAGNVLKMYAFSV